MGGSQYRRRRRRRAAGVLAAAALGLVLVPASAQALQPDAPDPAAFEANGSVFAVARGGGQTFIGGDFTQLRARTGPGVRFNATTGRRIAPVAEVRGGNGQVFATAPDGAGGHFIGGDFTSVGGEARNNIAHILPSGNVDPAFNPNANGIVHALAADGGAVYAGGEFTTIGSKLRQGFAQFGTP